VSSRRAKQEEEGELRVFLKFLQKSVSLAFIASWSVFKLLGKGLECFID